MEAEESQSFFHIKKSPKTQKTKLFLFREFQLRSGIKNARLHTDTHPSPVFVWFKGMTKTEEV